MTIEATPAAPVKLAVGATTKAAFKLVFGNLGAVTKVVLLPLAVSLLLSGLVLAQLAEMPKGELESFTTIPLLALQLVPFALFAGAVCRRLLPDQETRTKPLSWLRAQLFYVACFVVFFVVVSLPFGFATVGMMPMILMRPEFVVQLGLLIPLHLFLPWALYLFPFGKSGVLIDLHVITHFLIFFLPFGKFMTMVMVWTLPYYLLVLPVMARLSLVFPAAASNRKMRPAGSWRLTRGNGLRLSAVLLIIAVFSMLARSLFLALGLRPVSLLFNAIHHMATGSPRVGSTDDAYYWSYTALAHIGEFLLLYLGIALTVAALAEAYGQLSGGQRPASLETQKTSD